MTVARARYLVHLGWLLFLRDYHLRYRQTYLGSLWAVSKVVLTGLPLVLVGGHFGMGGDRSPMAYAAFALVGLIIWQIFWDAVISPQWIARRMRKLCTEIAFPRAAIVIAGCGYVLFNATIYLVLIGVAMLVFQVAPPATLALGLIALPGLIVAGLAVGMFFVPLTYVYLDFRYGLPFLSQFLLWTAPIFYVSQPDQKLLYTINRLNPLTYLIDIPRQWVVAGPTADDWLFAPCILAFAGVFVLGARFYRRAMPLAIERLPQR